VFTALVSAIIGGLVTALFLFVGVYGSEDKSDSVTIKEVAPPHESPGATARTPAATEDSSSVREDGYLSALGLSVAAERVYDRSWYRGNANLGNAVAMEDQLPDMFPNWEWPSIRGMGNYR